MQLSLAEKGATNRTQSDRAFEIIRADILACRILPGSKIRINELAEMLEVSMGAVREALSRLGAEGLVLAESQKGYKVAPVSVSEFKDLTEARIEIEKICLSRSVKRGDLEWESELVAAWHRLMRTEERAPSDKLRLSDNWVSAHASFHTALVSACGSSRLLLIRQQLYEQSERYRRYSIPVATSKRDLPAEHKRIFDAAIARRAKEASEAIGEHLTATLRIISSSPILKNSA